MTTTHRSTTPAPAFASAASSTPNTAGATVRPSADVAAAMLAELAGRVAADGIAAHHDAVVAAVRASGLEDRFPVLAQLVVDGNAPPVARERAIGRLAAVAATQVRPVRTAPTVVWEPRAA